MTAATRGQPDRGDKTAGRRRASGRARWREDKRHGSHGTHGRSRRSGGQAEGRQEGREERGTRMATRLERGGGDHGSRQGAGRERKKEIYKYLREIRREKRRRDSQKRASVCIYILLNTVACWLFIALSFIYIEGYYIYDNIYIIPINVYFSFKVNGIKILHYYIWIDNVYFTIRM